MSSPTVTTEKPRLSLWQIWNMSFGFFGIQFGMGLQMANMSAIYQYLGADESDLPLLWLAAPLTGLIVQPIVGYLSDRTWTGLGRRRPYFLIGAILSSLALIAMPNVGALWMAAGMLWILDASLNISMEPFRAFVGDLLPGAQRKVGFAMQSVLIGGGAVLASVLPFVLTEAFGVSREAGPESAIPPAVHIAFYAGAVVVFLAVVYTVVTTKEYPPEDMEAFRRMKEETKGAGNAFREILTGIRTMPQVMRQLALVQFFTWLALFCMWLYFPPAVGKSVFGGQPLGSHDAATPAYFESAEGTEALALATQITNGYEALKTEINETIAAQPDDEGGFLDVLARMFGLKAAIPSAAERIDDTQLRALIVAHGSSVTIAADAIRDYHPMVRTLAEILHENDGDAKAAAAALAQRLASARAYQKGTAWGGVCFGAYNLIAFGFSFALLWLVTKFSAKRIHLACLAIGGLGLASAAGISSPDWLILSMVGVGVAWASILSMPYAMLSNVLPSEKMGFYMGVFNFFIVLPQIFASLFLGVIVRFLLGGSSMGVIVIGGISMIVAAALTLRVDESATEHAVEEEAAAG